MNLEEMKKKFDSGEYILVSQTQFLSGRFTKWEIKKNIVTSSNHLIHQKLIHQKHKDILNAYLADDGVGIKWKVSDKADIWHCRDFIDEYDEHYIYELKEQKMIDLTNTWCEATEENYNKLLEIGYSSVFYNTLEDYKDENVRISIRKSFFDFFNIGSRYDNDLKGKQIHLVNGKFEYLQESLTDEQKEDLEQLGINKNSEGVPSGVTSDDLVGLQTKKKDCQFAKYGFEKPEFECEILKVFDNYLIGYIKNNTKIKAVIWYKTCGTLTKDYSLGSDYNLTPLKKQWYETKKVQALLKELLEISEDEELNQVLKAHILED